MTNSIYGQVKAGKGSLIGNTGEYFVLAELLRRGIVAALAPRNMPDFDILAVEGTRSLKIRVKTKTAAAHSFVWNVKTDGTIFRAITRNDVVVLVDLATPRSHPTFYALPTRELNSKIQKFYGEWLAAPGRGGRKREATRVRRLFPSWRGYENEFERGHLQEYEGDMAWALVERLLGRPSEPIAEVTQT